MLAVTGVSRHFGGVQALRDVSLTVEDGEIFGLIGPNGAGKTTLVNVLTGYVRADSGSVTLAGEEIVNRRPHSVAAAGVSRTFQNIRLFRELSVLQNIAVGMHNRRPDDTAARLLGLPAARRQAAAREEACAELMVLVGLDVGRHGRRPAGTLAYGDQRRVEIARALAVQPRVLVLDEPAAGMSPPEKDRLGDLVRSLPKRGVTVFLIEHDLRLVHRLCDRVAVLDFGQKIAEGSPADVVRHQAVVAAYLGRAAAEAGEQVAPVGFGDEGGGGDDSRASGGRRVGPLTGPLTGPANAPAAAPAGSIGPAPTDALLDVRGLRVAYGAVQAVEDLSFWVGEGELVTLIGANGAGKSSVLRALSGIVPARGSARFAGMELLRTRSAGIVRAGLLHVPEGREILARLTVEENLELGVWSRSDGRQASKDVESQFERFPLLADRRHVPAGQLSGGEQQILAVARALVGRPRLLLLDEPSLGLAPRLTDEVLGIVQQIHEDGLTVVLVEQNAFRALEIADRAYVIETGRVVLSGAAAQLRDDPEVRRSYLGA